MGIHIPAGATIAGCCAADVRSWLRAAADDRWSGFGARFSTDAFARRILADARLRAPDEAGMAGASGWAGRILAELRAAGAVALLADGLWQVPREAEGFLLARTDRRTPLAAARALVERMLDRCAEIGRDRKLRWHVRELRLFGSVMRGEDPVGDVDVAVDLAPKAGPAGSRKPGRCDITRKIHRFSPRVSVHELDEIGRLGCDSMVLWRDGARIGQEPVCAAPGPDILAASQARNAFNAAMQRHLVAACVPADLRAPGGLAALLWEMERGSVGPGVPEGPGPVPDAAAAAILRMAADRAAAEPRLCTRCGRVRPARDFGAFARRWRRDLLAECRGCKRQRDRRDAAARRPGLDARKAAAAALARRGLDAYRLTLRCAGCGRSASEAAIRLCGHPSASTAASQGLCLETVLARARAQTPYCRACGHAAARTAGGAAAPVAADRGPGGGRRRSRKAA